MENLLYLLLLLPGLLLAGQPVRAQATPATRTISGWVQDCATSNMLPGATIRLKGTSSGTATNGEGRYTLAGVPAQNAVLRVEHIGYVAQEVLVPPAGAAPLTVTLTAAPQELAAGDDGSYRRPRKNVGYPVSVADIARKPAPTRPARRGENQATTRTISGRVTDAQGHGLMGAAVQLKGTKTSATTDATGLYTLAGIPLEESILLFNCRAGRFNSRELPVAAGANRLDCLLQHPCSEPPGSDGLGGPK